MTTRLSPLLLALALAGCIDKAVPVEFYGLCGFDTNAAVCKDPAGKCASYMNGQLYLYYENQSELFMAAEYHNQRPNNADVVPGGVNTANAIITEYRYKFAGNPPVALSPQRVAYLSTPIGAGGTATLYLPVVPFETVLELRASGGYNGMLNVEITPRGKYGDESTFEAASLTIPAWVFSGAPAPTVCPDPAQVPSFCPTEFQTHTVTCGAGTSTGTFTIAGSVVNLTATGLVLANPGSPNLVVNAGEVSFSFGSTFADGASYNITVQTQPTGQTCTVSNGTGTISGTDPVGISVTCAP